MKNKMPAMLLSCVLLGGLGIGLSSCGGNEQEEDNPSEQTETTVINSIKITDLEGSEVDTIVVDNSEIDLKATVDYTGTNNDAKRVTWSSSDESVATVVNGSVAFGKINDSKEVTITATSKVDSTKSASITFTVKHAVVNVNTSRPDSIDTTDYLEKGFISQKNSKTDTSLMFADIFDTKFYVEAEFRVKETNPDDPYPKFGLMVGTDDRGVWLNTKDSSAFYYGDFITSMPNNWTTFNMTGSNEENTSFEWGKHPNSDCAFNVGLPVKFNQYIKMGLLRDKTEYFLFFGTSEDNYESFKCYRKLTWTGISADTPTYAWLGGWNTAVDAKNFKAINDPELVDKMIIEPTSVDIVEEGLQEIAPNDTLQLHVTSAPENSRGEIEWTSSNPTKIQVDKTTGKVTALETAELGDTAVITAALKSNPEVKSTIDVIVKVPGIEQNGNVEYTDESHFKIGKTDADLTAGIDANKVTLRKIKSRNFDLHYTISNMKVRTEELTAGNYWPKATLKLNEDYLCLGVKNSMKENYVRFESRMPESLGGWHNSNTYDAELANDVNITIKVRDGVWTAYINDMHMAVNFDGQGEIETNEYTRVLDSAKFAENDGYILAFTSDCCNYDITHFDITEYKGNIQLKSDDNFVIGNPENPRQNFFDNGVEYGPLLTYKNFDVTYSISNVKIPEANQNYPKGAFVVNGEFICFGHKTDIENYIRIETNTGGWSNSDPLEDSTVDGRTFDIKISVRDYVYTVSINGQLMKIDNGVGTTRNITKIPGQEGIKYAITAENMFMEISNFKITEIVE